MNRREFLKAVGLFPLAAALDPSLLLIAPDEAAGPSRPNRVDIPSFESLDFQPGIATAKSARLRVGPSGALNYVNGVPVGFFGNSPIDLGEIVELGLSMELPEPAYIDTDYVLRSVVMAARRPETVEVAIAIQSRPFEDLLFNPYVSRVMNQLRYYSAAEISIASTYMAVVTLNNVRWEIEERGFYQTAFLGRMLAKDCSIYIM